MKKIIMLLLLIGLCVGLLVYNFSIAQPLIDQTEPVTQPKNPTNPSDTSKAPVGQVRIANRDPDKQELWEKLASAYTHRTGVPVTVVSGQDETATLFTVRSQEELAGVKDRCADLSGTGAHAQLASWDLTLEADGKVCGIAAQIEGFGLIYNSGLLGRLATPQEITGLADLKNVFQTIAADPELGFGAFGSPEDSLTGFLNGKAVFYLGSTSDYKQVSALGNHNLGIMPLYLGGEEEQRQGLCVTCDSYWCVRSDAEALDMQATLDFLNDLVHPRDDGTVPVDDLQIVAPYRQAAYASNPLERTLRTDLAAGKEYVVCAPTEQNPDGLADALTAYAMEPTDENWSAVTVFLSE